MQKSIFTPEYRRLREELRAIRAAAGLSQRDLATRLDVPHSWVAKVETGERRIDLIEFGWFCVGCDASPVEVARALFQPMPKSPSAKRRRRVTT